MIFVEISIREEVERALKTANARAEITSIAENELLSFEALVRDRKFAAVLLPHAQAELFDAQKLNEIAPLLNAGTLRIAAWGSRHEQPELSPLWKIPAVNDRNLAVVGALLQQLDRAMLPGLHACMPMKSTIFSQVITSEKEVGLKLDDLLAIATRMGGFLPARGLLAHSLLAACLAKVFESKGNYPSMAKIQLGTCEHFTAFSVRWKGPRIADLRSSSINAGLADAFWLNVVPEASENEAVFLLSNSEQRTAVQETSFIGLDTFTNKRIAALSETRKAEDDMIRFEAVKAAARNQEIREESAKEAQMFEETGFPGAPTRATLEIEIASLKAEKEKLDASSEQQKRQVATITKNLSSVAENEKAAQAEIRSLKLIISRLEASTATAIPKENEMLRRQLAEAKQRELDLGKRLSAAVEELKQAGTKNRKIA